jgi:hypothetical protein
MKRRQVRRKASVAEVEPLVKDFASRYPAVWFTCRACYDWLSVRRIQSQLIQKSSIGHYRDAREARMQPCRMHEAGGMHEHRI